LPGHHCLTRKNTLGINLNALRFTKEFEEEFDFYPKTYLYPKDRARLKKEWDGNTVLIVKPEASCQGKGIYLTREIDDICEEHCVVQEYIDKPFLMEKMKFDLRLYVLVVGVNPLRAYLSREGLARLSTKMYDEVNEENLDDMMMHLTNYSINKNSTKFMPNRAAIVDSVGHKRSLKYTLKFLKKTEGQDADKLMDQIKDIICKTLVAAQPSLDHVYKSI
jgi:tubulin polyglutamylase TTLL6/13